MKRLVGFGLILLIILFTVALAPQPAQARNPQQGVTWSAAIAYFNPTEDTGELNVTYCPETGIGCFAPNPAISINSHYSGTLLVGATPGSEGSAVLSSNFQMPAVYKIAGSSGNPYGVIMLEFFTGEQVGTQYFYLPLVHKNADGLTSRIGIQNIESQPVDAVLDFYDSSGALAFNTTLQNIPSQSSQVFLTTDASFDGLLPPFEGSLVITATIDGTATGAKVVAASADINASGDVIHSYQGTKGGATSVYIPTVFCDYGRSQKSTSLHIQNTSGGNILENSVSITYYGVDGGEVSTYATHSELVNGQRMEIDACAPGAAVQGKQLSARISHASATIAAVIETTNTQGLSATSISAAQYCGSGDTCSLALPYVEWSSSAWDFQTSIYIMNTSGSSQTIDVTYYRRDGTSALQTFSGVPANAMVETNPTQVAGLMNMDHRDFKGAVMVEGDSGPVMALVLVTKDFQDPASGILTRGDSYLGIEYVP